MRRTRRRSLATSAYESNPIWTTLKIWLRTRFWKWSSTTSRTLSPIQYRCTCFGGLQASEQACRSSTLLTGWLNKQVRRRLSMRNRQIRHLARETGTVLLLLLGVGCISPAVHRGVPAFADAVVLATENSKSAFTVVEQ